MFKQLRKANQNDYLLITATLILLVVFNLSLLSYVQGQQKAAERDQAKDYEEALKFADAALYEVKIAGKNNFASYKSSLTEKKHHNQLGLGLRALAAGDPTPLLGSCRWILKKLSTLTRACWSCLAANCRQNSTTITASPCST